METMSIKEFYESFNELDSSNETASELEFFQPESNSKASHQLCVFPTFPSENISFNLGDSGYSDTSQQYTDNQILTKKIESKDNIIPKDTSFLPACQPLEGHQVYANQYTDICTNRNNTNNNTLKYINNRLEDVFKFTENIKSLSNSQFPSGPACFKRNVGFNCSSSNSFLNHNGQFNNINNFKNTDFISQGQPSNNTLPTHQHKKPRNQLLTGNKQHYYDPLRNTSRFNTFENTNLLPSCQPSTSRQAYASQYDPLSNISINIGSYTSLPTTDQPLGSQIFSNQYMGEPGYVAKCYSVPDEQSLQNTTNSFNHKGGVSNIIGRSSIFLPKTVLRSQYDHGSSNQENIHSTFGKDIRPSQESINPYEQVIDISKIISNLPLQELSNPNEPLKETANSTPININNIKSINVHVHHPAMFSSSGKDFYQSRPTVPPPYIEKNNRHDLLPNGPNTISFSTSQQDKKFFNGPIWMSMDVNPSDVNRHIDPPRHTIRDDIYLPTSEESCQSNDIDDWLNTLEVTPLEPYTEKSYELYLGSESQGSKGLPEKKTSSGGSKTKNQKRRSRAKITKDAVDILKRWYEKEPYPNYSQQQQISEETGHSVDIVRVWFQNRRQIVKKRHLMNTSYKENTVRAESQLDESLETQKSYCIPRSPQINFNVMQINENNFNDSMNLKENLTSYQ